MGCNFGWFWGRGIPFGGGLLVYLNSSPPGHPLGAAWSHKPTNVAQVRALLTGVLFVDHPNMVQKGRKNKISAVLYDAMPDALTSLRDYLLWVVVRSTGLTPWATLLRPFGTWLGWHSIGYLQGVHLTIGISMLISYGTTLPTRGAHTRSGSVVGLWLVPLEVAGG